MKKIFHPLLLGLILLPFPIVQILEILQAATHGGSLVDPVFYLLAWIALMLGLLGLAQEPDLPTDVPALHAGKRSQSLRLAIEALQQRLDQRDHQKPLHS